MAAIDELQDLVDRFDKNVTYYKDPKTAYNEHSCRIEYIDPLLELLGWDVSNKKGLAPQFREVIAENYSTKTDRPDYSLTLRGVTKLFVEAKKPSVDIYSMPKPAIQTRKYGWNAGHKIAILTNFEYLVIYDTTTVPDDSDASMVSRYKVYHYLDYPKYYQEILDLISRDTVYSGSFDTYFNSAFSESGHITQPVDKYFLIIEPNMLGQMYEMFLTEELVLNGSSVCLSKRKDCKNRSVVTTPTEIVKYIVNQTLEKLCKGKTPTDIKKLRIADIACGSGVFLEEIFTQLQNYCIEWYLHSLKSVVVVMVAVFWKYCLEKWEK